MALARLVVAAVVVMLVMTADLARGKQADSAALQALRAKLFEGYDKNTLPLTSSGPIVLNVSGLTVRNIYMDEKKHEVNALVWLHYEWNDHRFAWDPEEHSSIKKLAVSAKDVWLPDLSAYNSIDAVDTMIDTAVSQVILYPSGRVLHVPPVNLVYSCLADLTFWPNDEHNCSLTLGSWVNDGYTFDIVPADNLKPLLNTEAGDKEEQEARSEWRIANSSSVVRKEKHYDCCTEPYVSLHAHLVISRCAPAYTWLVKIPVVCFTLLTLVIFLLPPDAGEKTTFGGICLLLHLVFLTFAANTIRGAPTHTPLIVELVVVELVLVTASVVMAALVVRLARSPSSAPPPAALTSLAHSLSRPLMLSAYADEAKGQEGGKTDEVELADKGGEKADKQRVASAQWLFVSAFLDRLSLLLCLIVIIIVLGKFSSVL